MEKSFAILLSSIILISACGPKKAEDDPNKLLYNQVMDIHDEVMPHMEELYRLKKSLKEQVENSPDMVEEKRKQLEETILLVDSASKSMMNWMREFKPEDYEKEALRDYLDAEMKRVRTVKDLMLDALEKGRAANQQQSNQ